MPYEPTTSTPPVAPPLPSSGDGSALGAPPPPELLPPVAVPPPALPGRREGTVQRLATDVRGLADELRDWIELRLALARREVLDEVEQRKRELETKAKAAGMAGAFAVVALFYVLLVVGFLCTALLTWAGMPFHWSLVVGFLIASVLFAIPAAVLFQRFQQATAKPSKENPHAINDEKFLVPDSRP